MGPGVHRRISVELKHPAIQRIAGPGRRSLCLTELQAGGSDAVTQIQHWDSGRDGPLSEQALAEKLRSLGYRVNRYVYPPGTCFPTHTHAIDKIDAVLSGVFRLVLEGEEVELRAGDWVAVPRGAPHSAEVVGPASVISLYAERL